MDARGRAARGRHIVWSVCLLLAVPVMAIAATGSGGATDALTGKAIIERYVAKQDVMSEMALIAMVVSSPGGKAKEYRFLTVHRKRAEGGRDALLRVLRPHDVEGVALIVDEAP